MTESFSLASNQLSLLSLVYQGDNASKHNTLSASAASCTNGAMVYEDLIFYVTETIRLGLSKAPQKALFRYEKTRIGCLRVEPCHHAHEDPSDTTRGCVQNGHTGVETGTCQRHLHPSRSSILSGLPGPRQHRSIVGSIKTMMPSQNCATDAVSLGK